MLKFARVLVAIIFILWVQVGVSADLFCNDFLEGFSNSKVESLSLNLKELTEHDKKLLYAQLSESREKERAQALAKPKKLTIEQEKTLSKLLRKLEAIGVSGDVAMGVIEAFNDLNIISNLINNPMNAYAANPNSSLSPFANINKPVIDLDKIQDRIGKINSEESWSTLGSRVYLLVNFLKWLQASDDKRTKELGYVLAHNVDYIIYDGIDNNISYDRAISLLADTFEIVERSYLTIVNGRREIWQLEQLILTSEGSLQAKINKRQLRQLKRKIFWAQVRLGRYYGSYKTARTYLENLASENVAKCDQPCQKLVRRILDSLGITIGDKLKDPELLRGAAPKMEDIGFAFSSNRVAIASYLTMSIFLQLTDSMRTSIYTIFNTGPLLNAINAIPFSALRKPLKKAFGFGVYIRAKRHHFQVLHNIAEAESEDVQFDLLIKAHNERPGVMETASRLRHFPWAALKRHAKEKAAGEENQSQYSDFLEEMETAETQGREYGLITFDAKAPILQMLTLIGVAEGMSYGFLGVHLGPLIWEGLKESFGFVADNVTSEQAAIGAGVVGAAAVSAKPIKSAIERVKQKFGKEKAGSDSSD